MIVSMYLKSIWQIPLAPWLKSNGWAFPSGHLFGACAFYLWISHEMKQRWVSVLAFIIICGEAFGLLQQKYHHINDIIGAVGFVIPFLFIYNIIVKREFFQKRPDLLIIPILLISSVLMMLIPIMRAHVMAAFVALIAFGVSWVLTHNAQISGKIWPRIIAVILFAFLSVGARYILEKSDILPLYRLFFEMVIGPVILNLVILWIYRMSHCGGESYIKNNVK